MTNKQTDAFLEELKVGDNVIGIVLFGSWARGNNRDGGGEAGGFVTNQGVRSDFLDGRLDFKEIRGVRQKSSLFRV